MYSRSSVPRSATMRARIASSSRPSSSTWDSVRVTVMCVSSDGKFDVADGNVDAQLDLGLGIAVQIARADVAGAARGLHLGARETDAHAAAVFWAQPGRFGLFQQGRAGVVRARPAGSEANGSGGVAGDGGEFGGELLDVQPVE